MEVIIQKFEFRFRRQLHRNIAFVCLAVAWYNRPSWDTHRHPIVNLGVILLDDDSLQIFQMQRCFKGKMNKSWMIYDVFNI